MVNKIIWKVLLMVGGILGSIYSCPKFFEAYSNWEKISMDPSNYFQGYLMLSEYRTEFSAFGILSVIFIVSFVIGCFISVDSKKD